jgi:outer membrane receptor for ferric coprogen and ferric-rhodotorulic acid
MTPAQPTTTLRILPGLAALAAAAYLSLPAIASAQASSSSTTPSTGSTVSPAPEVVLDPFTVSTSQDKGYAATNEISGSRVDTPIKDIPISIDVITSQFISDIGATDLRSALAYQAGVMTRTQNDLENTAGSISGQTYGPGGVNNPQGVTSNPDQSQYKIRGFIATNTLRDGFLRLSGVDAVNIDRIEVVFGPNALLYGTGNFGGVVDYLPMRPMDAQSGYAQVSYGSYNFERATLAVTGPISAANHIDYSLAASYQDTGAAVGYYNEQHYFIAPQLSWRPTPTTLLVADVEYSKQWINGNGFQAFRGVSSTSAALPTNNDQFEAVGFYYPPGSDPNSYNVTGPDTFVDTQEKNIELKGTQQILKETSFLPSVDFLVGYNRSSVNQQQRQINGEIEVDTDPTNNGFALGQTITTSEGENSVGGEGSNNGNLTFGTTPHSVIAYTWNLADTASIRDQERVEIVVRKTLFDGKWYQWNSQALAGYSDLFQQTYNLQGATANGTNYWSPNSLGPIRYGMQGDGSPDLPETFNVNTEVKNWDSAYYLNYYAKLFKERLILMSGVRKDTNVSWDNNLTLTTGGVESPSLSNKTYQNGGMLEVTKFLSLYALKAEGVEPNFGGLKNAGTGVPVSSNTGKSNEYGIKFDAFNGKLTGTISRYTITKVSWESEPWFAPAPLGHVRFNPGKPIIYNLSDGTSGQGMLPNGAMVGGTTWAGNGWGGGGPASGNGLAGGNNTSASISAFNAAVSAGSIYVANTNNASANYAGASNAAGPNIPQVYVNASTPTGAAYLNAVFASTAGFSNGGWPGWMYYGAGGPGDTWDLNLNNASLDATGFLNTGAGAADQVVDQSKGYEGQLLYTPNDRFQIVLTASVNATVNRINNGTWPKYPDPQDMWAPWFFDNFGLNGVPVNKVYSNPQDTSTHVTTVAPGDDTPKYAFSLFENYKFGDRLKGLTVGLGESWHSQEQYFSGITHGSGQVETNAAGYIIVAYGPSMFNLDAFAKYEWKSWGRNQLIQLNVYNVLDDKELNGFVRTNPITAKLSYEVRL